MLPTNELTFRPLYFVLLLPDDCESILNHFKHLFSVTAQVEPLFNVLVRQVPVTVFKVVWIIFITLERMQKLVEEVKE